MWNVYSGAPMALLGLVLLSRRRVGQGTFRRLAWFLVLFGFAVLLVPFVQDGVQMVMDQMPHGSGRALKTGASGH